jgi:hypothetical protein
VAIRIWLLVTATRRGTTSIIWVLRVTRAGWPVLIGRASASISVPIAVIELAGRRAAATVVISPTGGAITARRAAAIIVVVVGSRRIATTSARGAGTVPVSSTIIWAGTIRHPRLEWRRWRRVADFLDADYFLALELPAIKLLDSGGEILEGLIFDETTSRQYI